VGLLKQSAVGRAAGQGLAFAAAAAAYGIETGLQPIQWPSECAWIKEHMRYPNLDVAARVQYINSVFIGPIRRATAKNFEHEPLSETKTKAMSYFGAKLTLQIRPLVTDAAAHGNDQPPTTAARTKRSIAPD